MSIDTTTYIIKTTDQNQFRLHFYGPKMYHAVYEYQQYLRNKWKYTDVEIDAWWKAAQELTNILVDHGINMEEDYY